MPVTEKEIPEIIINLSFEDDVSLSMVYCSQVPLDQIYSYLLDLEANQTMVLREINEQYKLLLDSEDGLREDLAEDLLFMYLDGIEPIQSEEQLVLELAQIQTNQSSMGYLVKETLEVYQQAEQFIHATKKARMMLDELKESSIFYRPQEDLWLRCSSLLNQLVDVNKDILESGGGLVELVQISHQLDVLPLMTNRKLY